MSIDEVLGKHSSRQLTEWMAYERITGPLDARLRGDISAGIVAATVANANGAKRKLKPSDFVPTWFKRKKTPQEIWQDVMQANTALGGTVRTRT
jgi:hypothetical protein